MQLVFVPMSSHIEGSPVPYRVKPTDERGITDTSGSV